MPLLTLPTRSHTDALAESLGRLLRPGDVVTLDGPMGAGKTTFVGALATALGASEQARSPTYTIAHDYALASGMRLVHLDLHRYEHELTAEEWGDIEPYFRADTIACIEWPRAIGSWLGEVDTWRIELDVVTADSRVARLTAPERRVHDVWGLVRGALRDASHS